MSYHDSRLVCDPRREILWKALWRYYFRKRIATDDCVLDLGCGYGEFINNVNARRRIGLDRWEAIRQYLDPAVEAVVTNVTDLGAIPNGTVDFAFASNLFEHLTQCEFASVLESLKAKFSAKGTLTIFQPNYRYAYREYFDDYTHVSVYSHISLADFLVANGYEVLEICPRFLPLTIKSRLPVSPALIGLYLASPLKPLGKQMLLRARPRC
ncbi:MAG: methyltransferase domain-containing protein [Sphingomicrobium sp.]